MPRARCPKGAAATGGRSRLEAPTACSSEMSGPWPRAHVGPTGGRRIAGAGQRRSVSAHLVGTFGAGRARPRRRPAGRAGGGRSMGMAGGGRGSAAADGQPFRTAAGRNHCRRVHRSASIRSSIGAPHRRRPRRTQQSPRRRDGGRRPAGVLGARHRFGFGGDRAPRPAGRSRRQGRVGRRVAIRATGRQREPDRLFQQRAGGTAAKSPPAKTSARRWRRASEHAPQAAPRGATRRFSHLPMALGSWRHSTANHRSAVSRAWRECRRARAAVATATSPRPRRVAAGDSGRQGP
jgi:hypothetical protein